MNPVLIPRADIPVAARALMSVEWYKWAWSLTQQNLALGDAAFKDVGTTAGTVAAGDHTHAQLHDAVTVLDSSTIDLTLSGQQVSGSVVTQLSITADASGVKLSGDEASPGNNYLYGTNASGVKGWYVQPAGGGVSDGDKGDITVSGGGAIWTLDLSLNQIAAPTAAVNFAGQQATNFAVENRTSDPGSPATGRIWLRTDL